ncbi:MAG: FHA domain-containing protein [Pseudomonadota bacterium]
MGLDQNLLDILVCPQCKGALASVEGNRGLVCNRCKIKFPVRDGIPIMLIEEAVDLRAGPRAPDGSAVRLPRVAFRVIDGPDNNMTFQLEQGTCRAIGRTSADPNKTTVFNVDLALTLDEGTRSLVLEYVARQFRKAGGGAAAPGERLGQFRRAPDIVLTDSSLSRLHAMIFSDESGVGILDLVSKNGTYVNGQEVESKILKHGDTIELGETTISFEG